MNERPDFFISLLKSPVKLFSEASETENESTIMEFDFETEDSEWKQEYELIYKSYSVE